MARLSKTFTPITGIDFFNCIDGAQLIGELKIQRVAMVNLYSYHVNITNMVR